MNNQLDEEQMRKIVKLFMKLYPPDGIIKIIIEEWKTDKFTLEEKVGNILTWYFQRRG